MISPMSLTLVILAAGSGSRFGGNKPLAKVGPHGQSLFEYSVYDAFTAGFRHVIFVVNAQLETSEFSTRLRGYANDLKVEFVVQSLTDFVDSRIIAHRQATIGSAENKLPSSAVRRKPWGTAHAVLVCREYIRNPFVVINADDYYGRENYGNISRYLVDNSTNPKTCALPGYRLENTLSNSGGVNRGICEVNPDNYLKSIREVKNIAIDHSSSLTADQFDSDISIANGALVSMTFWGFVPAIFNILEREFQKFLSETHDLGQDEFYLPSVVNTAINADRLHVKVFDTAEQWKGLTYATDLTGVRDFILTLTESGWYDDFDSG